MSVKDLISPRRVDWSLVPRKRARSRKKSTSLSFLFSLSDECMPSCDHVGEHAVVVSDSPPRIKAGPAGWNERHVEPRPPAALTYIVA
jgi:hypothetical protein